ncbi:MAG: AbrB/MazE/SpoVT family DNA-binding domain-containing protein [Methanobrevibacter sp.]|jgi:AbrB family looped-hinge helix DNA binding protein|nr:AbrB/MazE/SpoVT family DNA-binding domain-containing protein [Candidatus Methanovirga meridionalis]
MISTTKMYDGYQTVIPSEIRKKLNINNNDILEWNTTKDGKAEITFRGKKSIKSIIGIAHSEKPTNAVELKKMVQKGNDKL